MPDTRGQETCDGGNPCEPHGASEFPSGVRPFVLGVDSPRVVLPRALSSGISAFQISWEEDLDAAQVLVCAGPLRNPSRSFAVLSARAMLNAV